MDMQEFLKNRRQFPREQLAAYAGKYIAWSPDGTKIIASADDLAALANAVLGSGYNPEDCVLSSVPAEDAIIGTGQFPRQGP